MNLPSLLSLPQTMRAAMLYGKEDVRMERIPVPEIGPGELLLKVEAALTCGTDLKVFRRGYHLQMLKPPCLFGHEMSGTVAAAAPSPDGPAPFGPGERVVVVNSASCGKCSSCARGQENLCEDLQFLNGAYAEYLRVPARFVARSTLRLPEKVSFAEAALTEPLACVMNGLEETPPRAGDAAAVFGLGPIGLLWTVLLKSRGCRVLGVDRVAARAESARRLGADEAVAADAAGRWEAAARERWPRLDLVVEATGTPQCWETAISWVRRGGMVNLFSGCPAGTSIRLDTNRIHYDQITLKSTFHHRPGMVQAALAAIADGTVPASKFISGAISLEEVPALFKRLTQDNTAIKTCVLPGGR